MSDYILSNKILVEGQRVIELGAGAGLPSIVSILNGADAVVITDYPDEELVKTILWNVECNVPTPMLERIEVKVSLVVSILIVTDLRF